MTVWQRLRLPFLMALLVIGLDQASKWLVLQRWPQPYTGEITLIPWLLGLTYIRNEGVAFGLFQGIPQFFTVTALVIVAGLLYFYLYHLPPHNRLIAVLIGMVVGGALGNVIDRLRFGYVVDFIKTLGGHFPIFNVADSAVSVGVISLAIYLSVLERRLPRPSPVPSDDGRAREL